MSSVLSPALSFPSSENENSVFTYTRASDLQRLRHSLSTPRSFIANAVKICEDVIRRLLVLYKYSVALQAELSNQGQTQLYKKSPFPSNVDPPGTQPGGGQGRVSRLGVTSGGVSASHCSRRAGPSACGSVTPPRTCTGTAPSRADGRAPRAASSHVVSEEGAVSAGSVHPVCRAISRC